MNILDNLQERGGLVQIHTLSDGRLHIQISIRELQRLGADCSTFFHANKHTQKVLRYIFMTAHRKVGIPTDTAIRVTATRTKHGIALWLIPALSPPKNQGVYIFRVSNAVLPQFARTCKRLLQNTIVSSSLYTHNQQTYLLLYLICPPPLFCLTECATLVGVGNCCAACIMEYYTPLFVGDALERL